MAGGPHPQSLRLSWGPAFAATPRPRSRAGFALIAVIWSLGLITLLSLALIVGARYRARISSNDTSVAATELAADSAIHVAILTLLAPGTSKTEFPLTCRMPGGERATIAVEQETGKVDLNTASLAVLARLFTALTGDQSLGTRIAARVVEFRDQARAKTTNAAAAAPNTPAFTTIMQLDSIDGVSPSVFRRAIRFVTVRSGSPEPNLATATPAMLRLLGSQPAQSPAARGVPLGGSVTIRADVSAPNGMRFIREALVSIGQDNGRSFVIREWRHGDIEPGQPEQVDDRMLASRDCLQSVKKLGS